MSNAIVSNKAFHAYIKFIDENGEDPNSFFKGIGYDYSLLSDEKKFMPWDDYRIVTEALYHNYNEFFKGMTYHGLTNKFSKQILEVLSRMTDFRAIGDFILKYGFKTYYTDSVTPELIPCGSGSFDIKFTFKNKSDIFPVFIEMYKEVFLAIPKLFSTNLSWKVKISSTGNVVNFHVIEFRKKTSPILFFQSLVLKLFRLDSYYQVLLIQNLKYNTELEKKNAELEEAEKKMRISHREALLANRIISHDIANKMYSALSVTALMEEGKFELAKEKMNVFYKSIRDIIKNTRELVDDNSQPFQMSEVNIKEMIEELFFEFEYTAHKKEVKLLVTYNLGEHESIETNKSALKESVLGNILHNAIKFSHPKSDIKLYVFVENNKLVIKCVDEGIGISPNVLKVIQQSDEQSPISSIGTSGESGRGLGLLIARKVCNELEIGFKIESELSRGSTISLFKNLK